jgi:hypothetical protein
MCKNSKLLNELQMYKKIKYIQVFGEIYFQIFKFKIKKTHLFYIQNAIFSVLGKNDFL